MHFKFEYKRRWLVGWMYFISAIHFLAGIMFAWFSSTKIFDHYHQTVLAQFGNVSTNAYVHQWWLSLFGATLQYLAILLIILTYIGNKYRDASVWLWIIIGLTIWAPQDILISLRIDLWLHVLVDIVALVIIIPPLLFLWLIDRNWKSAERS